MCTKCKSDEWRPVADYDADGDCIEVLFAREMFFARPAGPNLTLYHSETNSRVVGCLIHNIKGLCKKKGI